MQTEYKKVFKELMDAIEAGSVSVSDVGVFIVKLSNHYADYNLKMVDAIHVANNAAKDCEEQTDTNGKAISSAKAKVLAEATAEAHEYEIARAHVQNIEHFIEAAKALQKGLTA